MLNYISEKSLCTTLPKRKKLKKNCNEKNCIKKSFLV